MRGRTRVHARLKWGLLAVAAGIGIAALASAWWYVGWLATESFITTRVALHAGGLTFERRPDNPTWGVDPFPQGMTVARQPPLAMVLRGWVWRPRWEGYRYGFGSVGWYWNLELPLWVPMALVLLPWGVLWRRDRRAGRWAREGLCAACGYNRAGIAKDAACPECGAAARTTEQA